MHRNTDGVVTWIEEEASGNDHVFHEVHVNGDAHLAFKTDGDQTPLSVHIGYLHGDRTGKQVKSWYINLWQCTILIFLAGVVHVGYAQTFAVNDTDADVSVSHYVYENARLTLPPRVFFYETGLHIAGEVFGIEDMYMFQGGVVAVNETGSLTTTEGSFFNYYVCLNVLL